MKTVSCNDFHRNYELRNYKKKTGTKKKNNQPSIEMKVEEKIIKYHPKELS